MSSLILEGLTILGPSGTPIVEDIGFEVNPGEIVGLVGESGSGKSMTSLALTGLLPAAVHPVAGEATLGATRFMTSGKLTQRPALSMVFQNAKGALNPVMRIGTQIERLLVSLSGKKGPAMDADIERILHEVGIMDADRVRRSYPHQLSGGMNQRVMIAMALAAKPQVLIADEPTTGLDVTVQAQILRLIQSTTSDSQRGVLLITHDLGVVAQTCDRVVVMYRGHIKEMGTVDQIFHDARDPYTRELIASASPEGDRATEGATL